MANKTYTKSLKCKLTQTELHAKGATLASLLRTLDETKATKKESMKGFNDSIKEQEADVAKTRDARETGTETRDVKVVEKYTKHNTVEVTRLDTKEVIETRPMTAQERQTEMSLKVKPSKTEEARDKAAKGKNGKSNAKLTLADKLSATMLTLGDLGIRNSTLNSSEKACMRRMKGKKTVKQVERDGDVFWVLTKKPRSKK